MAGFGAVPALAAVYYRLTISESPRYTLNVEGNHEQAAHDAVNHVGSGVHSKTGTKKTVSPLKAYGGKLATITIIDVKLNNIISRKLILRSFLFIFFSMEERQDPLSDFHVLVSSRYWILRN